MNTIMYQLKCLTNLHMGNGDVNYNVIDLEVERDPVLMEPTMNASGVKGALRDFCTKQAGPEGKDTITYIFGSENNGNQQGAYQFMNGDLVARPVRVSDGEKSYILATTPDLIEHIFMKVDAFTGTSDNMTEWNSFYSTIKQKLENVVICGAPGFREVEGLKAEYCTCERINWLMGTTEWVIMGQEQLSNIDLPVLAHNILDNGKSKNLWYEEVVPHESIFLLLINAPEKDTRLEEILEDETVVQFGAGATTGCGFTLLKRL